MTNQQLFEQLLQHLVQADHVKPKDIPDLDLYMDQVTTFMETHLGDQKRTPEDKILTKTMINNYAKNRLLPSPDKKKYTREHMLLLLFIYYMKGFLSLSDIETIFTPLNAHYFANEDGLSITDIYEHVFELEKEEKLQNIKDLKRLYERSTSTFLDQPEEERDLLQSYSMICLLAFDVYLKKQMIEMIIDQKFKQETAAIKSEKKENKKAKKPE